MANLKISTYKARAASVLVENGIPDEVKAADAVL